MSIIPGIRDAAPITDGAYPDGAYAFSVQAEPETAPTKKGTGTNLVVKAKIIAAPEEHLIDKTYTQWFAFTTDFGKSKLAEFVKACQAQFEADGGLDTEKLVGCHFAADLAVVMKDGKQRNEISNVRPYSNGQ